MPISRTKRKAAAKKTVRTRKKNQTKRRTVAKKAARTRKLKRSLAKKSSAAKRSPI